MTVSATGELAESLQNARATGQRVSVIPAGLASCSRADGYELQARYAESTGQPVVGWKIAATSAAGQQHIRVSGPMAGRILADRVYTDADTISLAGNSMRVTEPEFVFVMADALPPRAEAYTRTEVLGAVADLRLGIELPSTRYLDATAVGEIAHIADNACAYDFVLGPLVSADWRSVDLAQTAVHVDVTRSPGDFTDDGLGANVLGHPLVALTWLVNELSSNGITLHDGQFVTTGTCCTPVPVLPGDRVLATFAGLGSVSCTISDGESHE